jgi:L-arabinokinase
MVQLDSIRVDVDATLPQVERLYARRSSLVRDESDWLREQGVDLVVVDIPALPLAAAARLGIPRLAVGNFAWDWIYSGFLHRNPRWKAIAEAFRADYAETDLLLRLPFAEEMRAFPHIVDIPLVASPGSPRRREIAELAGCNPKRRWILLSFTTLDLNQEAVAGIENCRDYEFFTVLPLEWRRRNIRPLDRDQIAFSDVVASVDAVVSKPGFGILSNCVVNRKPLIYVDREDFLEYQILEAAIRKYLKHIRIPAASLYRGELQESLEALWKAPDPVAKLAHGGDIIAARRIAEFPGILPGEG